MTSGQPPVPPPIVSSDGRFYWNGQSWVPFAPATQRPVRRRNWLRIGFWTVIGVAALAIVLGWSGLLSSGVGPVSIPGIAEHCSIRYPGANVIVVYDGPNASASCTGAYRNGWSSYVGAPLGGLACYGSKGSLHWKVYDTGLMLGASETCSQLQGS